MPDLDKKLLIFDSGAGGLSIADKILQDPRLLNCQLCYMADNEGFPYGEQPDEVVIQRCFNLITEQLKTIHADMVVIACNTASTLALPYLRESLTVPVIGVVPAIKPAAQLSASKIIGLLATPATVEREYTRQLISEFAENCEVILFGSSALVHAAETLFEESIDHQKIQSIVDDELKALLAKSKQYSLDTIVLGCTHFPLLLDYFKSSSMLEKKSIQWVDSGDAIVNRIVSLLGFQQFQTTEPVAKGLRVSIVVTGDELDSENKYRNFLLS